MAAEQVEAAGEGLGRVVLRQAPDDLSGLTGGDVAHEEVDHHAAEGVVHRGVELGALQVVTRLTVADLVGGVLPDLAEQKAVRLLVKKHALDVGDELLGELIGHVETPPAGAGARPVANDAVLAKEQLAYERRVEVEVGHVGHAPPALVGAVLVKLVGATPGGVLALPGALAGVVAVSVEVEGVVARVVKDAVQDDGDAELLGGLAELAEVVLGAEDGIDLEVVGRVVAMVARCLKDGVEVDGRDA